MYHPVQLASFALMQFQHGLQGLTEEEAQLRLTKADGSQMNSLSWIVGRHHGDVAQDRWGPAPPHLNLPRIVRDGYGGWS